MIKKISWISKHNFNVLSNVAIFDLIHLCCIVFLHSIIFHLHSITFICILYFLCNFLSIWSNFHCILYISFVLYYSTFILDNFHLYSFNCTCTIKFPLVFYLYSKIFFCVVSQSLLILIFYKRAHLFIVIRTCTSIWNV